MGLFGKAREQGVSAFALLALLSAAVACGGSDSDAPATQGSPVTLAPEVQRAVDDLEGKVGFRPVAPTYLPEGLDPTPETAHVNNENQQTAIIAFFPLSDNQATPAPPAVLEITEDPSEGLECPLCPGGDLTETKLAGESALAEAGELSGEELVYYVLYFIVGDLLVTLNAEWDIPDGADLTEPSDEMKQQLVRVAESMIAQG